MNSAATSHRSKPSSAHWGIDLWSYGAHGLTVTFCYNRLNLSVEADPAIMTRVIWGTETNDVIRKPKKELREITNTIMLCCAGTLRGSKPFGRRIKSEIAEATGSVTRDRHGGALVPFFYPEHVLRARRRTGIDRYAAHPHGAAHSPGERWAEVGVRAKRKGLRAVARDLGVSHETARAVVQAMAPVPSVA